MGIIGFLDEGDPTTATPSHHLTAATPITSTWRSSISTSNKQKVISSDNIHDNECTESNVHERQTKNNVHHSQVKISLRYRLAAFHLFMKWLVDIFFCLNLGPFSNHYTNFYSLLRNCRRIRILVTASSVSIFTLNFLSSALSSATALCSSFLCLFFTSTFDTAT